MNNNNKYSLISVEGNIGSGKSTLVKMIRQRYPKLRFLDEPVNEWTSINGDPRLNLLGQFYEDPKRWAYTMQVYAFYSRLKHWKKALLENPEEECIFSERGILSDQRVFAVNGHKNGLMDEMEFNLQREFYDWLVDEVFGKSIKRQLVIYLQVDPAISFERMQKRGRDEEKSTIGFEYIRSIHERHEEWLGKEQNNRDVLILNADKEFENDLKQQDLMFEQIEEFLKDI